MARWTLYAVQIDTVAEGASPVLITGVQDWAFDPGLEKIITASDGMVDPTFASVAGLTPALTFSTLDLKAILDVVGISGKLVDSDVDNKGIRFWLQKFSDGAGLDSGSVHTEGQFSDGIIIPLSISASQGGDAVIQYQVFGKSTDGVTSPLIISLNQSLPGTPGTAQKWTVGKISINGTDYEVTDASINFGLQPILDKSDGHLYPKFTGFTQRQPLITVTSPEVSKILNTFKDIGAVQTSTDTVLYLTKRTLGSGLVAAATTEHIAFNIDDGMIQMTGLNAGQGGPGAATLEIQPIFDDTNAIIVINTAIAIT